MVYTPLVSVCVIAYNSSKTIIETLESIKSQTYRKIELLIGDDCSNDDTMECCRDWLDRYADRFVNVRYIKADRNRGIAANCNQVWKVADGEWIKSIAGDDILLPHCIEENVAFVQSHQVNVLFSSIKAFKTTTNGEKEFLFELPTTEEKSFFALSAEQQYEELLIDNLGPTAPSAFINAKLLLSVGYANEDYPFLEDYPLWLIVTKSGEKLFFMDGVTVLYRFEESITRTKAVFANPLFFNSIKQFWYDKIKPELVLRDKKKALKKELAFMRLYLGINWLGNKPHKLNLFLLKCMMKIVKKGLKLVYKFQY